MTGVHVDANSSVWQKDVAEYEPLDSWTDRGERVVVNLVADRVRDRPILDVGVGTGRSSWFLRLLSQEYVGIDYTPAMIERARALRPDVSFRVADARDLGDYADGSFALVFFSHAGIDSLDHEGRRAALREFSRVLAPAGLLVYSTLNRDGSFYRCGPGPVGKVGQRPTVYNYARFAARAGLHPVSHLRGFANVRRLRRGFIDNGAWALDTMPTHDWSLVVHFVTRAEALREVADVGLDVENVIAREGHDMGGTDTTAWFHVIASKPR